MATLSNRAPTDVLVAVVSYASADTLRACVEPLAGVAGVTVVIADNNPGDGSAESVAGLPVIVIPSPENGGFGYGCNRAVRSGPSTHVLLLNPDARLAPEDLETLVAAMAADPRIGLAAPRILEDDGRVAHSIRRFPSARRTFARALMLHRLLPTAAWADEVVRDPRAYRGPASCDWVSGACMLVRRDVWDRLGGMDEGYFLYSEDTDLCRRIHDLGLDVRYVPSATCRHTGGASAPRASLYGVLAESRIRYARIHDGRLAELRERAGLALEALIRIALGRDRAGHRRTLRHALGRGPLPSDEFRGL